MTQPPEIKHATIVVERGVLQVYCVWFYSHYGIYQNRVDVLKRQLQKLD